MLVNVFDFCIFVVKVYVRQWITCRLAVQAPLNDLHFLRSLREYKNENEVMATTAINVFLRHLWYLSEQNIGFAFFDSRINDDKELEMVDALNKEPNPRNKYRNRTINDDDEVNIASLVSKETMRFFEILSDNRPLDFLAKHPKEWQDDTSFISLRNKVFKIIVSNEPAERTVALTSDYNVGITQNEDERQKVLKNVEFSRKTIPDKKKSTIVTALKKD